MRRIKQVSIIVLGVTMSLLLGLISVNAASSDATAPEVTKIEMETQSVKDGEEFTITVYYTDESGIDESFPGNIYLERSAESEADGEVEVKAKLKAVEDGKCVATFKVDDTWVSGEYHIKAVLLYDKHNNLKHIATYIAEDRELIPEDVITVLEGAETLLGDVNGDSVVQADDLTTLARHLAKIQIITDDSLLKNADTTKDGVLSAEDLTNLAKYVAKIIPEL